MAQVQRRVSRAIINFNKIVLIYRGTSLMRNSPPTPTTTIGPYVESYCRILRGRVFLMIEAPL